MNAKSLKLQRIAFAQINPVLGDLAGNAGLILRFADLALTAGAQALVVPANCLLGEPAGDLVSQPDLVVQITQAKQRLEASAIPVILTGFTGLNADLNTELLAEISNELDWQFLLANQAFDLQNFAQPVQPASNLVWLNQVGGQGEQVFAGKSLVFGKNAEILYQAKEFEQDLFVVDFSADVVKVQAIDLPADLQFGKSQADNLQAVIWQQLASSNQLEAKIYQALLIGLKDFINKNGFKEVLLGLSGGIDSGLVLALAVDALGASRVEALMMPFHYTAQISLDDAAEQATMLGVQYSSEPIAEIYNAFQTTLADKFAALAAPANDLTNENLQARIRGVLLMALSNKTGKLVLTTSNKSEIAVGYSTLYGDMVGGLAPLKNIPKTMVYALAKFRNTLSPAIPERVITRPPSAELSPDQLDQDSLPEYEILDEIIDRFIEQNQSLKQIIAANITDSATVKKVIRLVETSEYKRQLAAPGILISKNGFSRARNLPIINRYRETDAS